MAGTFAGPHATNHPKVLAIDAGRYMNSASTPLLPAELRASVHSIAEDNKLIEVDMGVGMGHISLGTAMDVELVLAVLRPRGDV